MSEYNTKTWRPNESEVRETYEVFHIDFLELIDKIDKYWYAKKAPNQSARLVERTMEKFFTKKKKWDNR